jgi:hypothetical protein
MNAIVRGEMRGAGGGKGKREGRPSAQQVRPEGEHLRCAESHGWLVFLVPLLSLLFDWGGGLTAAAAEAAYPEEKS